MWPGRRKQPPIRTLIGDGASFQGDLRFTDGLRIDGDVRGSVIATGAGPSLLVIAEHAHVEGKVLAGHVIVNGEVRGPVHAVELLELQPKARIFGDVMYGALEMHQGAQVDGHMRPAVRSDTDTPILQLATKPERLVASPTDKE
ncbi:MAG: polymer-forming cytoskeletal protein [Proteobacteria bacterium]|nr:polymer-forming cytoskeletal protein [Pseudomonadota bacterium]